jgi:dipeptidyl aminopeptidase/acylaminoacyl peptidase
MMQAGTALPKHNLSPWVALAALMGLALLSLATLAVLRVGPAASIAISGSDAPRAGIAYFEFGETMDTLWLADANYPSKRSKLLMVAHAAEYGVVPSLAPDGRRFVFTALPVATRKPSPETPAGLWLKSVAGGDRPVLIARDVDLLVQPVWSPDGRGVVYRRSVGGYGLYLHDTAAGGEALPGAVERLLVEDEAALFPVAFTNDGRSLFYVRLSNEASDLYSVDVVSNETKAVVRLADGMTRDWALSPDGDRLAYLVMTLEAGKLSSQGYIANLAGGTTRPITSEDDNAFAPLWSRDGSLIIGRAGSTGAGLIRIGGEGAFKAPVAGFDVPLLQAPGNTGVIVSSFDGASATTPGASALTLITPEGSRRKIASGEVTFLGWVNR